MCSASRSGHPPVQVQNARSLWKTAIFPARSLNKVFSFFFSKPPRVYGWKCFFFFSLEQMLLSKYQGEEGTDRKVGSRKEANEIEGAQSAL